MLHILHTLRSKWAHSRGSKLHKSEQKLFIVTGRWYCRQKWLLTLWKYGCNGLTKADFFSFCWLERNLLVSVREKYFLNGGMSQACRLYNIFASLHPLEAMNLRCYTCCLKHTFLFIRRTTSACVCTKSTTPATIPVQHTPV